MSTPSKVVQKSSDLTVHCLTCPIFIQPFCTINDGGRYYYTYENFPCLPPFTPLLYPNKNYPNFNPITCTDPFYTQIQYLLPYSFYRHFFLPKLLSVIVVCSITPPFLLSVYVTRLTSHPEDPSISEFRTLSFSLTILQPFSTFSLFFLLLCTSKYFH